MMSLFSSFDLWFSSSFYIFFSILIFNFLSKVLKLSFFSTLVLNFMKILENFFLTLKFKSFNKNFIIFFLALFIFLFGLNFSSVLSFNFAATSQISLILFLGFSIWMSFLLFFNINQMKGFLSHCIPEGTPFYLTWFLFLIELVSNCIRPLTVTVRLVANILAGHLLMILLSNLVMSFFAFSIFYTMLNLVEMFVALIQAYIFSTMLALYYADVV